MKTKRMISALLALVLVLGIALPIRADAASVPCFLDDINILCAAPHHAGSDERCAGPVGNAAVLRAYD